MKLANNIVTRNLREWLTLSFILFGFFYLTGDTAKNAQKASGCPATSQIALESADTGDPHTNDFSGSENPVDHSLSIIIAVDAVNLFGNQSDKKSGSNSQFANQTPKFEHRSFNDHVNTLSLVDSDLANSFTLVGQKPSGTS